MSAGRPHRSSSRLAASGLALLLAGAALAADVGVGAQKLVVVDRTTAAGTVKVVFVSKDPNVTKGSGTDIAAIDIRLDVAYADGRAAGAFTLPAGASDGMSGWIVNGPAVAKYVNTLAPAGPTGAKVGVVKPGTLLKLAARSLGDEPLDVLAAGPPPGVHAVFTVTNGVVTTRHCTTFAVCDHRSIAGGTGAKLVCRNGVPVACPSVPTTTTTTLPFDNCMSELVPGQGLACFGFCSGECGCAAGGECFLGKTPCSVSSDCSPFQLPCVDGACLATATSCTSSADCVIADACACATDACACF